jgi:hypothetical protein
MKRTITFLPLTICLCLLVGYNFMFAGWSAPTDTPPGNNTEAPLDTGATTQDKSGNLMANIMAAATSTWSPEYCDELGSNCWDPATSTPSGTGSGIGYNQTWQIVNRAQGVWYQNTTPQPIMLFHKNIWDGTVIDIGSSPTSYATVNFQDYDSDLDNGSTVIVPVDFYYRFNTYTESNHGHYLVRELREPSNLTYTYAWQIGAWGSCQPTSLHNTCSSTGVQTRTLNCVRSDGIGNMSYSNCPAPTPITSRSCYRNPTGDC